MSSDFGEMADRVSDFSDELARQHERETEDAMEEMQSLVQAELRRGDSVARGVLVGDVREGTYGGSAVVSRHVHVPEWAKFTEHGTGARGKQDTLPSGESYEAPSPLPPLDPILTWAIEKNVSPREYDTVYGMVGAIQESIGEVGTKPHPFLRPVWYGTHGYRAVIRANRQAQRTALRRL